MSKETESFVRTGGLYRGCHHDLKDALRFLATTEQSKRVRSELVSFVVHESLKAKAHERLLGSSEVIESVFGKLKYLEKNQANSGFTALLPCIAALVSKTTGEVVRTPMETVRTKDVFQWCRTKLGKSVQARKRALYSELHEEQKQEEFDAALAT